MRAFDDLINSLFNNKYAVARQRELERQAERDKYQKREYVRQQDDNSYMGQPIAVIDGVEGANMAGQGSLLAQARAIQAAEREHTGTAESTDSVPETESFLYKPATEGEALTPVRTADSYTYGGGGYGCGGGGMDYGGSPCDCGGGMSCGGGCGGGM